MRVYYEGIQTKISKLVVDYYVQHGVEPNCIEMTEKEYEELKKELKPITSLSVYQDGLFGPMYSGMKIVIKN